MKKGRGTKKAKVGAAAKKVKVSQQFHLKFDQQDLAD